MPKTGEKLTTRRLFARCEEVAGERKNTDENV